MTGAEALEALLQLPAAVACVEPEGPYEAYDLCLVCGHFRKDHQAIGVAWKHADIFECTRQSGCDCLDRVVKPILDAQADTNAS